MLKMLMMKKLYKIFVIITFLFMVACNNKEKAHEDHTAHMEEEEMEHSKMDHSKMDHSEHQSMEKGEATDMSLYNLTSTWKTQEGEKIKLEDLNDKIQVISMAYTTCQFACPRIVADLKRIKTALDEKGLEEKVNFVLVSIDPKVDTPERLMEFSKENKMDKEQWTLLNGAEGDILELAALLGVKYKKTTANDYAHSNIITVLNKKGEIVHQQEGLSQDPTETIKAIEKLLNHEQVALSVQ